MAVDRKLFFFCLTIRLSLQRNAQKNGNRFSCAFTHVSYVGDGNYNVTVTLFPLQAIAGSLHSSQPQGTRGFIAGESQPEYKCPFYEKTLGPLKIVKSGCVDGFGYICLCKKRAPRSETRTHTKNHFADCTRWYLSLPSFLCAALCMYHVSHSEQTRIKVGSENNKWIFGAGCSAAADKGLAYSPKAAIVNGCVKHRKSVFLIFYNVSFLCVFVCTNARGRLEQKNGSVYWVNTIIDLDD